MDTVSSRRTHQQVRAQAIQERTGNMSMHLRSRTHAMARYPLAAIALAISLILPVSARAQYGYPPGYGGYGWGGWGSTIQGSTARGLGYFNMGRGAYNENTAVA